MSGNRVGAATAAGLVALAVVLPRLPALGTLGMMQQSWFFRVERFLGALAAGHFAGTYQNPHPGVTLMWIMGTATALARWLHGLLAPMERVWIFELAQVLWAFALMLLLFWALRRALVVYGEGPQPATWIALVPCLLIAIDPTIVTMTRSVSLDGPLGLHAALAVCLFLIALRTQRRADEVLAGIAGGLTVLTKMPGLIFVFGMGLWLLARAVHSRGATPAREALVSLVVLGATVCLTIVVCWPALWVAPADTLLQMAVTPEEAEQIRHFQFGELLASRSDQTGRHALLDVILHPHKPDDRLVLYGRVTAAWQYYPAVLLFKTPPVTLLSAAAGAGLALWARRRRAPAAALHLAGHMLLFGTLYFACMELAAKKTWRYMLACQVFLELGAGLTLAWMAQAALHRWGRWAAAVLAVPLVLQSADVLAHQPHYLTYYNPLLGGRAMAEQYILVYWGEGIGEAVRYMRDHARRHPIRFVSSGIVGPRASLMLGGGARHVGFGGSGEFLVLSYREFLRGQIPPSAQLYWRTRKPEHVVWIKGVPYAWIYRLDPDGARGF